MIKFSKFLKEYIRYIKKSNIWIMLILSVVMVLISIITPALVAKIITDMMKQEYKGVVLVLILLAIVQVGKLIINIFNSKLFFMIRKDLVLNIKKRLSFNILNLNIKSFDENKKGKFIQRLSKDPNIITDCLFEIKKYFIQLCTNIGIIIYILYLNPILGTIYAISFITILAIRGRGIKIKNDYRKRYYNEEETTTSILSEMLNGIKEIKLLNLKNEFSKKTNSHFENIEDYQYKGDFYFELYVKLTIIIQWITNALIILTSIWLIKKELIVIDVFITAFMYRINIFSFADSFTDLLNRIEEFNLVSNRIHEIMELYQPVDGEAQNEDNCQGKIEFIDVNFRYDKKEVLNNCCFKVEPQEFVVLTGKSGEGKTTILNLITKLYNIDSGKILIDDINIDQLSEQYIRKNISVISQNFYIFDMSIKENLLLAKPDATDEEIDDICKKVGIYDFIMSLPNKYETEVGEGGFSLSGGQRQRIAIARTLLKNSKIILCDEITSSLDKTLEKSIIELLEQLKEKHTIIVVTHKPDLIKKADKKYILENGTMYQEPQF